jgi:uncharacterized membrane protein
MSALSPVMAAYVYGALTAASLVAALFFFRFWRQSRDALFCCFAIAFMLLAGKNVLSAFFGGDEYPAIYLLRLAAFALIIFAILRKNLAR